jgi:hypothetical protein
MFVWQRLAIRHGREFVKHMVPAIAKPILSLWNQVIGFIFFVFAVLLGFRAVSLGRAGHMPGLLLCGFGALLTAWYAVSSFLRARRISRS